MSRDSHRWTCFSQKSVKFEVYAQAVFDKLSSVYPFRHSHNLKKVCTPSPEHVILEDPLQAPRPGDRTGYPVRASSLLSVSCP